MVGQFFLKYKKNGGARPPRPPPPNLSLVFLKFFDNFWMAFFQMTNQNARATRGGSVKLHIRILAFDMSASQSSNNLIS